MEVLGDDTSIKKVLLHLSEGGFFYSGFIHAEIKKWLASYAKKEWTPFPLPLETDLPEYSSEVLEATSRLPFGASTTYSALAARTNNPKAARGVGQILSKNLYPLFIPCHRVLAKNGLGGFTPDITIKKELLAFEGILSKIVA